MSIRLCNNAKTGLKLNESLSTGGRYVLEGVFAELGVMNVNHRIYTEEEYLKHLQYLRDDVKKSDLLGELDHPEDRFEVRVKEVSHRIIDIWYDQATKMVMGKIELLNTPNGLIAKELVDAGIPLHISSRAAGTINKDNTVSIQQIYTYDIVAKPGFAKATLHRVSESASTTQYTGTIKSFLERSEKTEDGNQMKHLGLLFEGACVNDIKKTAPLRREAIEINEGKSNAIDMANLTTHILESDEQKSQEEVSAKAASEAGVSTPSMDPNETSSDSTEPKNDSEVKDTEDNKDTDNKDTDTKDSDDKAKDAPFKIVSVEAIPLDGDNTDDKGDGDDEGDKDGDKADKSDDDNSTDDKSADECAKQGDKKDAKGGKQLFDDIKTNLETRQNDFLAKFEEIKNSLKNKKEVSESLRAEMSQSYPFTMYLNESDLKDFSALMPEQKNKVRDFLVESKANTVELINGTWRNGLLEGAAQEPTWLRMATSEYRNLYESASPEIKNNLLESAKYFKLEDKASIDLFWEKSGLKTRAQQRMINESFMQRAKDVAVKRVENSKLGYTTEDVSFYLNYVH